MVIDHISPVSGLCFAYFSFLAVFLFIRHVYQCDCEPTAQQQSLSIKELPGALIDEIPRLYQSNYLNAV